MSKGYLIHSVGKRKMAVARLYLKEGEGRVTVNHRTLDDYYWRPTSKMMVMQPLRLTGTEGLYDVVVNVVGGGLSGQAGAIRHALSRALLGINPTFRTTLKKAGLITRDARKKERKLPGQPGARKRFQFCKR